MNVGLPLNTKGAKLCDAQGKQIAVESMRLVEIRLPTTAGRTVVLKERVAISSRVTQPIPCFGYLLEHGFAIDGVEQALIHASGKINIPLQMQNKSMTILGHVRVLLSAPGQDQLQLVRAVRAEVMDGLINSLIGWTVSDMGYIVGRHLSDSFSRPFTCVFCTPRATLQKYLVTGDDGLWYSLELTEPLNLIVQLDAKFHDMKGNRSVITIITEGEKSPNMMGFQFEGEGPQAVHL